MRQIKAFSFIVLFLTILYSCANNKNPSGPENFMTMEEATDIVIHEVLKADTIRVNLYGYLEMISRKDNVYVYHFGSEEFYSVDYDSWFYFIDDRPYSNWAHSCRYVFVNATNGDFEIFTDWFYPYFFNDMIMLICCY